MTLGVLRVSCEEEVSPVGGGGDQGQGWGILGLPIRPSYLRGCTSNSGGCSSASSMAVMPRDQMSHSSLYPPFRATAATSGAILGGRDPQPGVTPGGEEGDAWVRGQKRDRERKMVHRENQMHRNVKMKGEIGIKTDTGRLSQRQRWRDEKKHQHKENLGKKKTQERAKK